MLSFSTIWYAVAAAAALLAAQGLAGYFKVDRNRSSFAQLAADLAKAAPGSQTYDDFVRELASSLATTVGVRVLLVDCFGKLDQLTREVLLCYLVRFADERRAELWVVFDDRDDGDSFDKRVAKLRLQSAGAGGRLPYGIRRVRYFNLDHLTRRARQDLAELAGFPERAVHVRVKAIVAQEDDRIAGYIGTVLAGGSTRSTQAVRVLYLLRLTATVGPNPVWSDSVLKDALARVTSSEPILRVVCAKRDSARVTSGSCSQTCRRCWRRRSRKGGQANSGCTPRWGTTSTNTGRSWAFPIRPRSTSTGRSSGTIIESVDGSRIHSGSPSTQLT